MTTFRKILSLVLVILGGTLAVWEINSSDSAISMIVIAALLLGLFGQALLNFSSPKSVKELHPYLSDSASNTNLILDALSGGVVAVDKNGGINYLNATAERYFNMGGKAVIGRKLGDYIVLTDDQGNDLLEDVLTKKPPQPNLLVSFGQVSIDTRDIVGRYIDLHTLSLQEQKTNLMVLVFRDVTSERRVIERLYQQAAHDALTGLLNRRSFENCVEQLTTQETTPDKQHILATVDLDHFKKVNDTCGHQAGDELLKQVARIFHESVRTTDRVGRLGGDEFGFCLPECGLERGKSIMDSVVAALKNHRFSYGGEIFSIGASIGVVGFVGSGKLNVKTLFHHSDKACYTAKSAGRNQVVISPEIARPIAAANPIASVGSNWTKILERALEKDTFMLFVQPIVPLTGKQSSISHYELLLRLPHNHNLLSPGSFLPAADRLGYVTRIDRWIISHLFKLLSVNKIVRPEGVGLRLMINLTQKSVEDDTLLAFIRDELRKYRIDPTELCFEITESTAVSHYRQTKTLMERLRELGCHLALDDFGSGFTSLSYIRDLPLTYIKIDGNFIHNMATNSVDTAIISAINDVSHNMGLETIAELVEDHVTFKQLQAIGIDYAQGYHCRRPYPLKHLIKVGVHPLNLTGGSNPNPE